MTDEEEKAKASRLILAYLDRIGIDEETSIALAKGDREPSVSELGFLLKKHLTSVPFENLSQHIHPAADSIDKNATSKQPIERIPVTDLPTLEINKTLQKIVFDRRGGFCWEINTAFAWLLRGLGYKVRMGCSHVATPDGPVPGHLCLYVDDLEGDTRWHVDPGFGDAPREPMPTVLGNAVTDSMIGDEYEFVNTQTLPGLLEASDRFPVVLMRRRRRGIGGSPMVDIVGMEAFGGSTPPATEEMGPPEPVYLLNFEDDLSGTCEEFREGLSTVLSKDAKNIFAQKRMCIILRNEGFDFVGTNYWKEVRNGREISRQKLAGEGSYRKILHEVAGIRL